ncbi:DUF262 domain-containing protein [Hymenobacter sp. BT683]|uniref:DUF262 domain-containing protein n=2 Tax=Hymenobacter jeongseonensis TaxID=2791027 RepID=A0ABS0INC5_9BACT|nr:DUF262 domain-containing protein [Hymenobacter jeongseonensis]
MPTVSPTEQDMWVRTPKSRPAKLSDEQINSKYDLKAERIVTETNREKLQNFYESLLRPGYMDPRPLYQRRQRWDAERQSKLIESLLINIPIPPLFVYETRPNVYEVMDGQQRISAIRAFYSNDLVLEKLDRWPELNGRTYNKLPERIKAGIDRRSISWITVLHESAESDEDALILKQLVFERLNTGGVKLSNQEIRNSLYQGPFNKMLQRLSRNQAFREAWDIPPFTEKELKETPDELLDNKFYLQLDDIELILRFFALRHAENYQRGMQGFLDLYMLRARAFNEEDILFLEGMFNRVMDIASGIYGNKLFIPFIPKKDGWGLSPQKAYTDAIMVGLSNFLDKKDELWDKKDLILDATKQLFKEDSAGVLTGRGNTKKDVLARIELVRGMYQSILAV